MCIQIFHTGSHDLEPHRTRRFQPSPAVSSTLQSVIDVSSSAHEMMLESCRMVTSASIQHVWCHLSPSLETISSCVTIDCGEVNEMTYPMPVAFGSSPCREWFDRHRLSSEVIPRRCCRLRRRSRCTGVGGQVHAWRKNTEEGRCCHNHQFSATPSQHEDYKWPEHAIGSLCQQFVVLCE